MLFAALLSTCATLLAQAFLLAIPEAPVVWCLVEPSGLVARVSAAPEGPEIPHGATMSAQGARWAYYYPEPTLLRSVLPRLPVGGTGTTLLLATGREKRKPTGLWREFRRCGDKEFDAALERWKNG